MSLESFVGRNREIQELQTKNWRKKSQLVVVYGRRRVGKTALIQEAYKDELIWYFDGIEGVSQREQLSHFVTQLSVNSGDLELKSTIHSWEDAFAELHKKLQLKRRAIVLFFDEFQWMASMRSQLVSYFKSAWDIHLSKLPSCRFVLCGSVSSFMVKKVLKSKALYGRVDLEINLAPLPLQNINEFFHGERSRQEVLEIAMTLGGIPQYLLELNPKYSLIQNLNEYALTKNGYFVNEYQRLFISHFGKNQGFKRILELLGNKSLTVAEISKKLGLTTGGTLTSHLNDLEWAGFIERYSSLNKSSIGRYPKYRILDEYLHFYFKFISPNLSEIESGGKVNYAQISGSASYEQWQGYAFERICRRNAAKIADHLHFSGIKYKSGSWYTTGRSGLDTHSKGAQIDLVFERGDQVLTVCECKWINRLTGSSIVNDFRNKIERIQLDYPRFGIEKVLILGKKIPIPDAIQAYFNHILFAEEVFF